MGMNNFEKNYAKIFLGTIALVIFLINYAHECFMLRSEPYQLAKEGIGLVFF